MCFDRVVRGEGSIIWLAYPDEEEDYIGGHGLAWLVHFSFGLGASLNMLKRRDQVPSMGLQPTPT
mgnify:CR=1 FL=1